MIKKHLKTATVALIFGLVLAFLSTIYVNKRVVQNECSPGGVCLLAETKTEYHGFPLTIYSSEFGLLDSKKLFDVKGVLVDTLIYTSISYLLLNRFDPKQKYFNKLKKAFVWLDENGPSY